MAAPAFSFLVCADSALLREELERQTKSWQDATRLVFWGDEEPGDSFWGCLQQTGLFAERRLVIVRQGELWGAPVWKNISQALGRPHEGIWPIFCLEVANEKGKYKIPAHIQKSQVFTFADKRKWVWRSPGLAQNKQTYVKNLAKKHGINFSPEDLAAFCAALPADAAAIGTEMAKLALLTCDGQKLTRDMLPPTSESLESDAFGLIRKLENDDLPGVWQELARDDDGSLLFLLIALLAREMRILWQFSLGQNPNVHPGSASRLKALARKIGPQGVASGFCAILDAEWHVKSGKMTPPQALEHLCVAIAAIFAGKTANPLP